MITHHDKSYVPNQAAESFDKINSSFKHAVGGVRGKERGGERERGH